MAAGLCGSVLLLFFDFGARPEQVDSTTLLTTVVVYGFGVSVRNPVCKQGEGWISRRRLLEDYWLTRRTTYTDTLVHLQALFHIAWQRHKLIKALERRNGLLMALSQQTVAHLQVRVAHLQAQVAVLQAQLQAHSRAAGQP